jgi:hypothetical protein
MTGSASLRRIAALMLLLATVAFMIGVIAERSMAGESSETRPSQTVSASSSEQSEKAAEVADSHDEGEAAEGTGEEGHTDVATEPHTEASETRETILGINAESTGAVAAAVIISLLVAASVWFWGTPAVLVVATGVTLLFAAFDLREVAHQLNETRTNLVVIALLTAVLHASAAVVAGLALTRRSAPAGQLLP